jgi:hypothetical protein
VYLGDDEERSVFLEREFRPEGQRIEISDRLNRVATALRQQYIDFIGELSVQNASSEWWRSCLAEKNPYISQAFFYACCVQACREAIRDHTSAIPILVVVDPPSLRQALITNLSSEGEPLVVHQPWGWKASLLLVGLIEMVVRQGYFVLVNLGRIIYARYYLHLHRIQPIREAIRSQKPVCITHVWVDQRAYNPVTGEFKDQDFDEVGRYLEKKGKSVFILPNVLSAASYPRVARYIAESAGKYIVPHAFLRPRDVVGALFRSLLAYPKLVRYPLFAGLEISDLIYQDIWNDWARQRAAHYVLIEKWVQELKKAGLRIERFIYTFENHAWEHVICETFRLCYPEARLIAHQPNGVPLFLMNYFISAAERSLVPLPDLIVTNGAYADRLLKSSGYPSEKIQCGGGLRQRYLQDWLDGQQSPRYFHIRQACIVVTPSIGEKSSLELVRKAIQAFQGARELSVILKCHPSMPFERIAAFLGSEGLPPHIEVSKEPLRELLREAAVLVYNDGTFPSVEALIAGVPVIYLEPVFALPLDPLDSFQNLRVSVRTAEELRASVRGLLADSVAVKAKREDDMQETLHDLIGRVSDRTYELFGQ